MAVADQAGQRSNISITGNCTAPKGRTWQLARPTAGLSGYGLWELSNLVLRAASRTLYLLLKANALCLGIVE